MSGYLEIKYPFKSNLGLNPFKSWKRQWCILRPSGSCSGGSLAVYCSEAGAAAGNVDLPVGSSVRRAKSRSRPYAFAVFAADDRKPRVLLAAQTLHEANVWMDKIRTLLNGDNLFGTETLLNDSYSVSVVATELAGKLGVVGDGLVTVSAKGVILTRAQKLGKLIEWRYVVDIFTSSEDKNQLCILTVDRSMEGGGVVKLSTPLASALSGAARAAHNAHNAHGRRALSKSDSDLRDHQLIEVRRSSWYSGPSEVSLDDIDLVMSKESTRIPSGQLSRCSAAGDLAPPAPSSPRPRPRPRLQSCTVPSTTLDDSMSDRRSLLSIASGIYEEIPDLPEQPDSDTYLAMGGGEPRGGEPTYESVADCVYATMRRTGKRFPPPPLPPRVPFGTSKLGSSWNSCVESCGCGVTRHASVGSLSHSHSHRLRAHPSRSHPPSATTLPHNSTFSVFRKRLKSDSRIASSSKSDTAKENKNVDTKKKKFDFTPTRDIFKSFKVGRKMKNLKITTNLAKGETKSCEFLDETEHLTANRCSKSAECLEDTCLDEFDGDLSIDFNDDAVAALALPQEIVDLILRGREQLTKIRLKDEIESDYMPMSPIVPPPPIEHHYIVMSPKTNLA